MNNPISIGHQIRSIRENANMPLRKLAALLDIDQSTLSKIERDERRASLKMIDDISKIFNLDKKRLLLNFYSDKVSYEIVDENNYKEMLEIAEAKIKYMRSIKLLNKDE